MISVRDALQILNNNLPKPRLVAVTLEQAFGCCLGEDIEAPEPSPRYTNSAMDGYAIRWADASAAGGGGAGVRLQLIGESQAGLPFAGSLTPGCAVRISTGAMLPEGADTVVRVEDTMEEEQTVIVREVRSLGQDVRHRGEEFAQGDRLFARGCRLMARELALLAAVGIDKVRVYSQPQVAVLVTGTELAPHDGEAIQPHQIRDSNSIMLVSAVKEAGGRLARIDHVADSLEETILAVRAAIDSGASIIICSGGVSVGRHDHVKEAALAAGFSELFWKIKQKPGKPLFVARRGETLLFGLPGNPVSAFMCFINYVRPVLANLLGTPVAHHGVTAAAAQRMSNSGKRTLFVRVEVEDKPNEIAVVREVARQGSHMLTSIVSADGYVVLQPGEVVEEGDLVEVVLFA